MDTFPQYSIHFSFLLTTKDIFVSIDIVTRWDPVPVHIKGLMCILCNCDISTHCCGQFLLLEFFSVRVCATKCLFWGKGITDFSFQSIYV